MSIQDPANDVPTMSMEPDGVDGHVDWSKVQVLGTTTGRIRREEPEPQWGRGKRTDYCADPEHCTHHAIPEDGIPYEQECGHQHRHMPGTKTMRPRVGQQRPCVECKDIVKIRSVG